MFELDVACANKIQNKNSVPVDDENGLEDIHQCMQIDFRYTQKLKVPSERDVAKRKPAVSTFIINLILYCQDSLFMWPSD